MNKPLDISNMDRSAQALGVWVRHDATNDVWYVERSDIPGLNAEAPSLDELVGIICDLTPDLIAANMPADEAEQLPDIPVCVQHMVNAKRAHAC